MIGMHKVEMENPNLPGQSIWVLDEAVPMHMASGWSPVDAEVSEQRAAEEAEQRAAGAEEQAERSRQAQADADAEELPEQPEVPAEEQSAEAPRQSRQRRGPTPAPQGPDQNAVTENQE